MPLDYESVQDGCVETDHVYGKGDPETLQQICFHKHPRFLELAEAVRDVYSMSEKERQLSHSSSFKVFELLSIFAIVYTLYRFKDIHGVSADRNGVSDAWK